MALRVAILTSGDGKCLRAILDHIELGILRNVEVSVIVCSSYEFARKIERCGMPSTFIEHEGVPRAEREAGLMGLLEDREVDLVVLAGYNYILSREFVERYRWRCVNVHPSLLPAAGGEGMYGRRVHMMVCSSGAKVSGPTVHFLDVVVDKGPIIEQWPIYIGDVYGYDIPFEEKVYLISNRVSVVEQRLVPKVVQLLADGKVRVVEHEVSVPRVMKEGDEIKLYEERRSQPYAIVDHDDKWFAEWVERQRAYLKLQEEEWANAGLPLREVLGPCYPNGYMPDMSDPHSV